MWQNSIWYWKVTINNVVRTNVTIKLILYPYGEQQYNMETEMFSFGPWPLNVSRDYNILGPNRYKWSFGILACQSRLLRKWSNKHSKAVSACVAWTLVSVAHVTTKWTYGTLAMGASIWLLIVCVHRWCAERLRGVFIFAEPCLAKLWTLTWIIIIVTITEEIENSRPHQIAFNLTVKTYNIWLCYTQSKCNDVHDID